MRSSNYNHFSQQRLMGEIRRLIMSQPTIFLLQAVVVFGVVLLSSCFIEYTNLEENLRYWNPEENCDYINNDFNSIDPYHYTLICILHLKLNLYILFSCIGGSMIFFRLRSKYGRIALFSEPTLCSEKFAAQFLIYSFGLTLLFLFSCFLTDILRPIIMGVSNLHLHTKFTTLLPLVLSEPEYFLKTVICSFFAALMFGSLFMVGAVVWPRNSFIKTVGFLMALAAALALWIFFLISVTYTNNCQNVVENALRRYWWLIIPGICSLVAVYNWCVTYIRIKESEIQ